MPQVPTQLDLMPTTLNGVNYDLSIYQGDTYELELRIPIDGAYTDLTGATAIAQVREFTTPGTVGSVLATFTMTLDADQTTNPGLLVLSIADTATDDITPNAPDNLTAAAASDLYFWDFQLTFDGEVHTHLRGYVNVYPQISKP